MIYLNIFYLEIKHTDRKSAQGKAQFLVTRNCPQGEVTCN